MAVGPAFSRPPGRVVVCSAVAARVARAAAPHDAGCARVLLPRHGACALGRARGSRRRRGAVRSISGGGAASPPRGARRRALLRAALPAVPPVHVALCPLRLTPARYAAGAGRACRGRCGGGDRDALQGAPRALQVRATRTQRRKGPTDGGAKDWRLSRADSFLLDTLPKHRDFNDPRYKEQRGALREVRQSGEANAAPLAGSRRRTRAAAARATCAFRARTSQAHRGRGACARGAAASLAAPQRN